MPDIKCLKIWTPTSYNVSYSWNYGHSSHYEHWFKKATSSTQSSRSWRLREWDGNSPHITILLHSPKPEELTERMRIKKNQVRRKKMQRIREKVEKLEQLKRELWLTHKWSQTESGTLGIVWWNQEYWDNRMGLKRLRKLENGMKVKKEEPLTPPLHIKVESPPIPCLHYPPSSMSSSCFHSIDPNDFVWSNSSSP